ncbi:hypothetical protein RIF29_40305 [Crotalaria pallida]|uniref:Uncharacterized protein n=1 Tax=Crotalaria pallida TaxID=3830 RepID=A0AAN9HQI7_CROPI
MLCLCNVWMNSLVTEQVYVSDNRMVIPFDEGLGLVGKRVKIAGYVGLCFKSDKYVHLELDDGTCAEKLQVTVDASVFDLRKLMESRTYVLDDGVLKFGTIKSLPTFTNPSSWPSGSKCSDEEMVDYIHHAYAH